LNEEKVKETILVIDDEEHLNRSTRILLESNDFTVDCAMNGNEALGKIRDNFYNLIIIDVKLPDMEGTELLKEIRKAQPNCKKIIITGYPNLQNTMSALNEGADAYVTKPFKPEKLIDLVQQKLEEQKNANIVTEKKVATWIQERAKNLAL
jgi:DNA-binding NtrC family response regulator